jgi:DNA-binding IscR family transcriptional regulator
MECLEEGELACQYCEVCNQISVWGEAQRRLAEYLASVSLGQIADKVGLREELAHRGQGGYREAAPLGITTTLLQRAGQGGV